MAKPLIERIQVSLRALQQSNNDVITSIKSLLVNETFGFIFNQDYLAPLLPYIVSNCTWCVSVNTSLANLILSQLNESILEDIPTALQDIIDLIDQLNTKFIVNALFLDSSTDR